MRKKVLLAVDECVQSKNLLKYVAKVCAAAGDVRFTLFHVKPFVPEIFARAAKDSPAVKAELDETIKKQAELGACDTHSLKEVLQAEGVPEDRIETIVQPIKKGLAKDILTHAEEGRYDAIAMARRGLTPSRDFFIGTVAEKIVEHALDIPVWIIDGPSTAMDFLLAVDGSENSMRDVDHIVRMVGPNPDFTLMLFHVLPHLRHYYSLDVEKRCPNMQTVLHESDGKLMDAFYRQVYERLNNAGIDRNRISEKTNTMSYDISTAVLDEARRMEYGTIVVGRRGERKAFFTGRIAMRVVQKLSGRNLWILP
jgi:nucleotide-binding universal stress UspA family protein